MFYIWGESDGFEDFIERVRGEAKANERLKFWAQHYGRVWFGGIPR